MKQHSKLFVNLIFVLAVLAIAGVLFALRAAHATGSTLEAELIYGDANTVQKFSLDNDATYDVDTGYYTVHIEVKDGAARFVDSPCPDHICAKFRLAFGGRSDRHLPARPRRADHRAAVLRAQSKGEFPCSMKKTPPGTSTGVHGRTRTAPLRWTAPHFLRRRLPSR